MKVFIFLLALSVLCSAGMGNVVPNNRLKAQLRTQQRVRRGYGGSSYGEIVKPVTVTFDRPVVVSSGYGQQQQTVSTVAFDRPVVSNGYGQQQQIIRTTPAPIQQQTIVMDIPVRHQEVGYGAATTPAPVQQTIVMDISNVKPEVSSGYGQQTVQHTISLDEQRGAYGAAPAFSLDTAPVQTIQTIEVIVEAPEFRQLCVGKNAYGAQVSTVFYVPHPTDRTKYIQCDEFGRAFLKQCPVNTVFTGNLVCEKINEIHTIETVSVQQDRPVLQQQTAAYGGEVVRPVVNFDIPVQQQVEDDGVEAPEFRQLCQNHNSYGVSTSLTVFYIPHPTKQTSYIQCDDFGRSFLKNCPANTVFTQNLVCENIENLLPIESKPVVTEVRQLDQQHGAYGAAPSFSLDITPVQTIQTAEVIVEAPEFKQLCLTRNSYGVQTSSVFYVAHPTDRTKYVQCNEFGTAFLKQCPSGTWFTSNLVCELM
jgi:hypothetical protein